MASGDVIETIEVIEPNLTLNMNNSKEISGYHEAGEGGEADDKDNSSILNRSNAQDVSIYVYVAKYQLLILPRYTYLLNVAIVGILVCHN
ncbi:hypothetical protein NQ315_009985 [Exocentrus adspersus]|uniref:Uncharacterized protein n=1 Tax=Exocentrus adspersus TaxID=1586481 RepID=A0AAV8WI43_9CUCU|nr:hypothetical protein NQ315_009985 [Exocentrus adspersus]